MNRVVLPRIKENETCVRCGSQYELTRNHNTHHHLNHKDKVKKELPYEILCATCHALDKHDYNKSFHCYFKAQMKKYNQRMDAETNRLNRLIKQGIVKPEQIINKPDEEKL